MAREPDGVAAPGGNRSTQKRTHKGRAVRVPTSRSERIGKLGGMMVGVAGEAALEGLRRIAGRRQFDGSVVLTPGNLQRMRATLAELRGAAMKLGQLASLHGDDLLPPELSEVLAGLRNRADFMPMSQLESVLQNEIGSDWRRRVLELDPEPLAAASIGQVHSALDTKGNEIVLKVQYPGVALSIDSDVDNLASLLRWSGMIPAGLGVDDLLDELKRELHRETDYLREAEQTEHFRLLLAGDPEFFVPSVNWELTRQRILVLDRVHALPIEDLRGAEHPQALRDRMATALVRLVLRELFEFGVMQTDPNFANYLFEPRGERIALLDFGAARAFPESFVDQYRTLVIAAVEGRESELLEAASEIGFANPETGEDSFLDLVRLCAEPLRARGPYDFTDSDLVVRLRERGWNAYRDETLPTPPASMLFLNRKLGGTFLLCAHLKARVDFGQLYRDWVAGPARTS